LECLEKNDERKDSILLPETENFSENEEGTESEEEIENTQEENLHLDSAPEENTNQENDEVKETE
jgi:hypothetical protein